MKVAFIGPAHPLRGGIAFSGERLAQEFVKDGDEVTFYSFSLQYPSFLFPGKTQFSGDPAPANLHIVTCINSINPFNWIRIGNWIKKSKPDIVVVRYWLPFMGPCLGTILRRIKSNGHTRIICLADNILPHEKRIGDKPFTRYFVKPVDAFVTMSKSVLDEVKLFAPGKPAEQSIHPIFDNFGEAVSKEQARAKLGISPATKLMLFFGFIRKYKGLDMLIEALALVNQQQPGNAIRLLIAGEFYDDKKSYDEQIERLGLAQQVTIHSDFIPGNEVKYHFCGSDLVVQPYRDATQSGVTPLAYHFEIPMIVTNVGGLPELVPDDIVGLVAEPNAASIAEKIMEYFEKGEAYFLPGLREEKKKISWARLKESIMRLAQSK